MKNGTRARKNWKPLSFKRDSQRMRRKERIWQHSGRKDKQSLIRRKGLEKTAQHFGKMEARKEHDLGETR